MNDVLGAGNTLGSYLLVLLVYGSLFVVMRYGNPTVAPAFRKTFIILYFVYAISIFIANYVLYRLGVMSFLPWLNNFMHTFIWIGLCLNFVYAGSYNRPIWEQFVFFFIFSFVVKLAEHQILGTWEQPNFFGISGNLAYMLGWSLVDGLTPVANVLGLRLAAPYIKDLVVPEPKLR
ncbi:MAG: hypothetical protein JNM70_13285 [Anaerolineae bacterium]|nr:hypothetical protein [Anaerolineae bacterium]